MHYIFLQRGLGQTVPNLLKRIMLIKTTVHYLFTHCSVFVKVGWNNDQILAELLSNETWHGRTDTESPGMVI